MKIYIEACAEHIVKSSYNYIKGIDELDASSKSIKIDEKNKNNAILEFIIGYLFYLQVTVINSICKEYYDSNSEKFDEIVDFKNLLFDKVLKKYLIKILSYRNNGVDKYINSYISLLNDRFSQYSKYKLVPAKEEGLKNTFHWELGKIVSKSLCYGKELLIIIYTQVYLTKTLSVFVEKVFNKKTIEQHVFKNL